MNMDIHTKNRVQGVLNKWFGTAEDPEREEEILQQLAEAVGKTVFVPDPTLGVVDLLENDAPDLAFAQYKMQKAWKELTEAFLKISDHIVEHLSDGPGSAGELDRWVGSQVEPLGKLMIVFRDALRDYQKEEDELQ